MKATMATPFTPKTIAGRKALQWAVAGTLTRASLANCLRQLKREGGNYNAEHCLAWIWWIGGYPMKTGGAL